MMVMVMYLIHSQPLRLRLLPKLATRLMSPQVIESRETPLTPQSMILAQCMLMFRPMRRHMSFEIAAFTVEIHVADGAVHFVPAVVGRDVFVADVFVRERLGTVGECAFEGAFVRVFVVFMRRG